jgi:hypothetical protein
MERFVKNMRSVRRRKPLLDHAKASSQECDCENYCDNCSIVLTLSARMDKNSPARMMEVTSKDLVVEALNIQGYGELRTRGKVGQPIRASIGASLPFLAEFRR